MNYWATIYKCLWGAAIVLILIVMISFFVPKYRTLRDYQKRRYELQQENRQKEAATADLRRKEELIQSDAAFIRQTARGIGMVEKDEVVFKFTNTTSRMITNAFN